MYDENNIFAKILRKEISCNKVYEDENSLFFHDINPQAKIHVLGIPKVKKLTFFDFTNEAEDKILISFFKSINIVIKKLQVEETGFRIITNAGDHGGQEVPHFHVHILAGERIGSLR